MGKRFFVYGLLGWSLEICWTGLNSLMNGDVRLMGFTNLWMFFIYGCAIFLEPIHDRIREWKWLVRGILWVIIIWGIEFTSGLLLYRVLGVYPWVYTGPFAIQGLIRLDFAPAWFLAGFLFEKIHKLLDAYMIA